MFGLRNQSARNRCLEAQTLTLEQAVLIAQGADISETTGVILEGKIKQEVEDVNKIRLCGDYKTTVNPNLIIDDHPLPTIDELFVPMSGGKLFTKLDLNRAYLQLEIDPLCREALTLNTHKGLYQPTRLMFGVASAPAIWQRFIEMVLKDIPGVSVYLDDILITGENDKIHLERIHLVLDRLNSCNMRLNFDKCHLFQKQIDYCGYRIDEHGIHKIKDKVDAIVNMPRPRNRDEVRSFVGAVNYYGRFLKRLSTIYDVVSYKQFT